MKKKLLLLMLVTILFSGCSVKYNLRINEDLSVNEEVEASEGLHLFKVKTGQDSKVAANSLFQSYKKNNIDYTFTTVEDNGIIKSTASTSFSSLDEYVNYFQSDVVKEVNMTKKGNNITLEFKQDEILTDESSRSLPYDSVRVSIYVPFRVTSTNAERVEGNYYIWEINKEEKAQTLKITFNPKETDTTKKVKFGIFEVNIRYSVLMISGILGIGLLIVAIVYFNNKKNNRI